MLNAVLITPFAIVVAAILCRILLHPQHMYVNSAQYCDCAKLILQGKLPYVDFVSILPPYVFYWFVPPAGLASVLSIAVPLMVSIFAWLMVVYSLSSSLIMIQNKAQSAEKFEFISLLFGFALFSLPVFLHIADKEQVFVLVFMPFFVMRRLRQRNEQINLYFSVVVGALLGMVICFKPPQFIAMAIAPELYWWLKNRNAVARLRDPEIVACMATIVVNAIAFLAFAPCLMRHAYLNRWLPLMLPGYRAYFCRTDTLLSFSTADGSMLANGVVPLIVCICAFTIRRESSLIMPLLAWTIMGWFVYISQQKGWNYQAVPAFCGYFMLANLELGLLADWVLRKTRIMKRLKIVGTPVAKFAVYCTALILLLPLLIRDSCVTGYVRNNLEEVILRNTCKGDPVLILTTYGSPAYPCMVQLDRRPASRYLSTHTLRMCEFLKNESPRQLERMGFARQEGQIVSEIFEDIRKTKPRLIAISLDRLPWDKKWTLFSCIEPYNFNRILNNYRSIGKWNNCMVWTRL